LTIAADDGGQLAYDLIGAQTDRLAGPHGRPCVVMAHGLGGTRDCGLSGFASNFAEAGADVVIFDYRHFGESSGEPRQLVSPPKQTRDYHAAVRHARSLPGVDPYRIIVWGCSFSGGHVLRVAAEDPRIFAAISLTPAVSGPATAAYMLKSRGPRELLGLMKFGIADGIAAVRRRPPVFAPLAGRPGDAAVLSSPGAMESMLAIAGPTWRNEFAARLLLSVPAFRPDAYARRVRCPVLMQIADNDQLAPARAAERTATRLGATTHHYPCDHFDVYTGAEFHDPIARHQAEFLHRLIRQEHRESH